MTEPQFDITPFLDQDEGQHFDRKSLFEGARGTVELLHTGCGPETDTGEFGADTGESEMKLSQCKPTKRPYDRFYR